MKYILLGFISIHFLISCASSEKKTYRLSDEQLTHLLFDIHFADVILTDITPAQKDSLEDVYWKKMNDIYHLSKDEIREEIDKLESEPEKLMIIIERVKAMADSIQ